MNSFSSTVELSDGKIIRKSDIAIPKSNYSKIRSFKGNNSFPYFPNHKVEVGQKREKPRRQNKPRILQPRTRHQLESGSSDNNTWTRVSRPSSKSTRRPPLRPKKTTTPPGYLASNKSMIIRSDISDTSDWEWIAGNFPCRDVARERFISDSFKNLNHGRKLHVFAKLQLWENRRKSTRRPPHQNLLEDHLPDQTRRQLLQVTLLRTNLWLFPRIFLILVIFEWRAGGFPCRDVARERFISDSFKNLNQDGNTLNTHETNNKIKVEIIQDNIFSDDQISSSAQSVLSQQRRILLPSIQFQPLRRSLLRLPNYWKLRTIRPHQWRRKLLWTSQYTR